MSSLEVNDINEVLERDQLCERTGGNTAKAVEVSFRAGHAFGEWLDGKYGISDWIAGVDHDLITPDVRNAGKPQ